MGFEALFATSSLDHSEARNDQGRHVKQELKKICDETAPLLDRTRRKCFFADCEKGPIFERKKILKNKRP